MLPVPKDSKHCPRFDGKTRILVRNFVYSKLLQARSVTAASSGRPAARWGGWWGAFADVKPAYAKKKTAENARGQWAGGRLGDISLSTDPHRSWHGVPEFSFF